MPFNKKTYRVVLASPGDLDKEREIVDKVIDETNVLKKSDNVQFDLYRWETDTYPAFCAKGPLGISDEELKIDQSDILIGIFYLRFGTPTHDADSGTVHEIMQAIKAWEDKRKPEIMLYFKEANEFVGKLSKDQLQQYLKVKDFKESMSGKGIYWEFDTPEKFESSLRSHLHKYLDKQKDIRNASADENKSPEKDIQENNDDVNTLLRKHREKLQKTREAYSTCTKGVERTELMQEIIKTEKAIIEIKKKMLQEELSFDESDMDPIENIQLFSEEIIRAFPYPIAQACFNFNNSEENKIETVPQLTAMDRLITYLIKYITAIFIGQVRIDCPSQFPIPESLRWLTEPATLESWAKAIDSMSTEYQEPSIKEGWRIPGVLKGITKPIVGMRNLLYVYDLFEYKMNHIPLDEPTVIDLLKTVATYTIKEWGGNPAGYAPEKIKPFILTIKPAMADLLLIFNSLKEFPLIYTEYVDENENEFNLRLVKFMGLSSEDLHQYPRSPLTVPKQDPPDNIHLKRKRLYIGGADNAPLIDIHPFFIIYRMEVFQLEHPGPSRHVIYTSCSRGVQFRPSPEARTFFASWLEEDTGKRCEDIPLFGKDGEVEEKMEPVRSDMEEKTLPLTCFTEEGREALSIALGEALRIGRFWLGVEFLAMGLSKQAGSAFIELLRELNMDPGSLRGSLRGFAGLVDTGEDWRQKDVKQPGAKALPGIRLANPNLLRLDYESGNQPLPVFTKRLMLLIEDAHTISADGRVGHNELLKAMAKSYRPLPMQHILYAAYKLGWSPGKILERITSLTGPDKVGPEPDGHHQPPLDRGPDLYKRKEYQPGTLLKEFGRNLTQEALDDKLYEAKGEYARKAMAEIGRVLLQKEANNPILLGDPGSGKTAVIEGFAWRVAGRGRGVIEQLAGKQIIELSAHSLVSGTKYRGELEERIQHIMEEVKAANGGVIVFIDEIHTILSSGSGSMADVADALKPSLARGEFPCIGATTVKEYRKYMEKDTALKRRFTPVWLEEADIEESIDIATGVASERLGKHHRVSYKKEAVEAAVRLSARYIADEALPGKAIKVLDQAGAGMFITGSISGLEDDKGGVVDTDNVLKVIASRTNIPVEHLARSDKQRLSELEKRLKGRVKGQDEAIHQVARVIKRAGAGLGDPKRSLGVFLFAGSTGVGKTELAHSLAESLFDKEDALFRIDMSEYMEKHQVSRLIGAPPGYVGYDEEGQLTGRLRRYPYSVILLDEIEKAHKDTQNLFLQLFDSGRLTDSHGNLADARNAIFVMTSNLGVREAMGFLNDRKSYQEKLEAGIREHFSPEFLNRLDRIIFFEPLSRETIVMIFHSELSKALQRLKEQNIEISNISESAMEFIIDRGFNQEQGARNMRRTIESLIIDELTELLIEEKLKSGNSVVIDMKEGRLEFVVR